MLKGATFRKLSKLRLAAECQSGVNTAITEIDNILCSKSDVNGQVKDSFN